MERLGMRAWHMRSSKKAKLPGMRGSLTESIWQPCTDRDEAALTRSFASPALTGLAL